MWINVDLKDPACCGSMWFNVYQFGSSQSGQIVSLWLNVDPAALKADMKTINIFPSGFTQDSAPNPRSPREDDGPDPPLGPPGDGGQTQNSKSC